MHPRALPPLSRTSAPDAAHPPRRWLRTHEAARHLGIGFGTLTKLRCYGGGPPYAKLGHTVVYHPDDLDAWVETQNL